MREEITIPFSPLPARMLLPVAERFKGIGAKFAKPFPYLEIELRQAELPFNPEQYGALMFIICIFHFIFVFAFSFLIALKYAPERAPLVSITVSLLWSLLILVQLSIFPKIRLKKKVRDIDRNLVFVLRTILVEIRSGVSLFDSLNMVANGSYGEISREFRKGVEAINTGTLEEDALDEIAANNPSMFFRRALWQIVNGMKAGADISDILTSLVDSLVKEQRNEIRQYGSSLRLLSLVYMMLGVIIPALGLTFLIILSSFPQMAIGEPLFWGLLIGIIIAQFMYLGVIKSSRPNLVAD